MAHDRLSRCSTSRIALVSGLTAALMAGGCTSPEKYQELRRAANSGVVVEIDPAAAEAWSNNQLAYLTQFAKPQALPGVVDPAWAEIARVGFAFIDNKCETYFSALDAYSEEQQRLRASTGLVGTASATLLAVANAATTAIAAVGGAFTLAQGLMDASAQTVLFSLPPTDLRVLREKAAYAFRTAYFGDLITDNPPKAKIETRSQAVEAIGGYAALCTPVVLKGLIGNTINQVELRASPNGRVEVTGFRTAGPGQEAGTSGPTPEPANPQDQVDKGRTRNEVIMTPELARTFSGPGWTVSELRTVQAAFCIPAKERGNVGPVTIANVNMLITGSELDPRADKSRIDDPAYNRLVSDTSGACDTNRHQNFYENTEYLDGATEKARLEEVQALFPGETAPLPSSFAEPAARRLIGRARIRCGLPNEAGHPFGNQVTPDLDDRLNNNRCGDQ